MKYNVRSSRCRDLMDHTRKALSEIGSWNSSRDVIAGEMIRRNHDVLRTYISTPNSWFYTSNAH